MPNVEIINFTGMMPTRPPAPDIEMGASNEEREFAARLLVFTKQTRLFMGASRFTEVLLLPWEDIEKELAYMAGTIPSSWEFVDVTFSLQQVSRACAQQITRTRFTPMDSDIFGSYAMQSFRVTELKDISYHINPKLKPEEQRFMADMHATASSAYQTAIKHGIPQEDARGLLPMDTHCNLIVKYNLRQLVDMLRTRDESLRVQGEYGEVAHQMKERVLEIWPWSAVFFEPKSKKAIDMIQDVARELKADERFGPYLEMATKLAKAADLLKK